MPKGKQMRGPRSSAAIFIALSAAVLFLLAGCGRRPDLILATTTSARDSGLYDILLPEFEKETGIMVAVVAVGTGQALKLAENGDADLLLVHAPDQEETFIQKGYGVRRIPLMHNYFVIAGPAADPARLSGSSSAVDAFKRIADSDALFVSRGDNSGTHIKELAIWDSAGITPSPQDSQHYTETGQGMGPTLRIADELSAYVLCDKATYLNYRSELALKILFEEDPLLLNPYSLVAVNPERHPHVNSRDAQRLIGWLTSPDVQRIIAGYRIRGEQLFWPDARPEVTKGGEASLPSTTSPSPSPKPSG